MSASEWLQFFLYLIATQRLHFSEKRKRTVDCSEIWVFKDRNNCKHFELSRFIIIELILMLHYWLCVKTTLKSIIHIFFVFFLFLLLPFLLKIFRDFPLFAIKKKYGELKRRRKKERNTEEKS
jgi:hypothetical protein